jgi:hypothetical protein
LSKYNPDFDLDLKFGEKYEDCLAEILNKGKVEVKTERDIWYDTGNIAIEVRYKGRPSGLSTTKADYWAHIMTKDGSMKFILLFPVEVLRKRVKYLFKNNKAKKIMGGDNNQSELVLISLNEVVGK